MTRKHGATRLLVTLICGLVAAACGTTQSNDRPYNSGYSRYGTTQSIEQVSGTRSLAVAGTVGGAIVGHEIQRRAQERNAGRNDYRIVVRMRDGSRRTFTENDAGNLRVGQDMTIVGDRIQM